MASKNIRLGYALIACNNLFFWMAPWLLFLLRYVSFSQVAIIQAVGLLTRIVAEVPTGALSDLLGKKRALLMAFLLTTVGESLVVWQQSYPVFILAFIVVNLGYSFYSGTMEAFMYDTLIAAGKEAEYSKVLSRQQAVTNGAVAVASLVGGFAYNWWFLLPWVLTVIAKLVGLMLVFFIDEPAVDTDRFSLPAFVRQNRQGFRQLMASSMRVITILLLTYGISQTFVWELLDDMSVVAFGYDAVGIGILYSVLIFLAIPFGLLYRRVEAKYSAVTLVFGGIGVLVLNYIFSPWIGIYLWTALFLVRMVYSPIEEAAVTQLINTKTPSKIRATTISTYELLRKIPYLFLAGSIGGWADAWGVKAIAFVFAAGLGLLAIPQWVYWKRRASSD